MSNFFIKTDKIHISFQNDHIQINQQLQKEIDDIWQNAVSNGVNLFNGKILATQQLSIKGNTVKFDVFPIEYKILYYQKITGNRFCYPVGVSGFTIADNQILLGKRSNNLANYPDYWENVPAGSLDLSAVNNNNVDYITTLLNELREETGITHNNVKNISNVGIIYNTDFYVYNILAKIFVTTKNFERKDEHSKFLLVDINKLSSLDLNFIPTWEMILKYNLIK